MPAQDLSASGGPNDPQDLLLKFQQSIAEKVSTTPPVSNQPVVPGEAGKVEGPVKSVKSDEAVQSVTPAPQNPADLSTVASAKVEGAGGMGNPNAILELTKADIFKLLGMFKIAETEKKKNLDEMEETIWQDFVEEDLPQMLKEDQKQPFLDFLKTKPSAEKIINFFGNPPTGGLPANFEEKYLAKTLEFKAEIAKEQIETLLAATDDPEKKKILEQAKTAASNGSWKQVKDLMMNFG